MKPTCSCAISKQEPSNALTNDLASDLAAQYAFAPQISPDGKNVAFANYEDLTGHGKGGNQIYLLNLVTEEIKCISVSSAYNGGGFHNQISDNKVLFQNQSPIFDPILGKNVYYSQEYDIASGVLREFPGLKPMTISSAGAGLASIEELSADGRYA